jgi:hypothetical protein
MGSGGSTIGEQKQLFHSLKNLLDSEGASPRDAGLEKDDVDGDPDEHELQSDDDTDVAMEKQPRSESDHEAHQIYEKANAILRKHHDFYEMKKDVLFCELVDVQNAVERAFEAGLTPLILDTSPGKQRTPLHVPYN